MTNDIKNMKKEFMRLFVESTNSFTNSQVKAKLSTWTEEQLKNVKNVLMTEKRIKLAGGPNSSIERIERDLGENKDRGGNRQAVYPMIYQELKDFWINFVKNEIPTNRGKQNKISKSSQSEMVKVDCIVFNTARSGQRLEENNPNWNNPDFLIVGYRDYKLAPGIQKEVVSIEVKTSKWDGADAIAETAEHSKRVHRSYLMLVQYPRGKTLQSIARNCEAKGIGLIDAYEPDDMLTWKVITNATYHSDRQPALIHGLLTALIKDEKDIALIAEWFSK